MRRRIAAAAIIAAGLATAGIAYAENQPADPSVAVTRAAATGAAAPDAAGGKAGVLKGAIHGDLLVRGKDGSTRTVTFDRGKITSISASAITIERPDGVSVSKDLNDQTVFNGTPRDQLTSGTPVIVVSEGQERLEPRQPRLERRKERLQQRQQGQSGQPAAPAPPGSTKPSSTTLDDGLETITS